MRDFNHSVGVLVKAYFDETLRHSLCQACAVGNLVADAEGYDLKKDLIGHAWDWWGVVKGFAVEDIVNGHKQVEITGYTASELNQIEKAFEEVPNKLGPDEKMFRGLMNVVSVLADIHGVDLETADNARKLFVKA